MKTQTLISDKNLKTMKLKNLIPDSEINKDNLDELIVEGKVFYVPNHVGPIESYVTPIGSDITFLPYNFKVDYLFLDNLKNLKWLPHDLEVRKEFYASNTVFTNFPLATKSLFELHLNGNKVLESIHDQLNVDHQIDASNTNLQNFPSSTETIDCLDVRGNKHLKVSETLKHVEHLFVDKDNHDLISQLKHITKYINGDINPHFKKTA